MGSIDKKHHKIVAVDTKIYEVLDFSPPHDGVTYELIKHDSLQPGETASLIKDADILITTTMPMGASALTTEMSPNLKLIVCVASGTDSIDLEGCKNRGIRVSNGRAANMVAVAEHAIALYFAARRRVLETHYRMQDGQWTNMVVPVAMMRGLGGELPLSCEQETMGIVGNGAIGERVAMLASALGMKVLRSERKGADTCRDGRMPFEEVLKNSTVLVLALPRTPDSLNTISTPEFATMRKDAVLINIARGGIVDENAMLDALKQGRIAGAATDVFAEEPALPGSSPLVGKQIEGLNLITTPHTAWSSQSTRQRQALMVKQNVDAWLAGSQVNVVV